MAALASFPFVRAGEICLWAFLLFCVPVWDTSVPDEGAKRATSASAPLLMFEDPPIKSVVVGVDRDYRHRGIDVQSRRQRDGPPFLSDDFASVSLPGHWCCAC